MLKLEDIENPNNQETSPCQCLRPRVENLFTAPSKRPALT